MSSIGIYMGFIPYRFFVFNTYFIFKLPPEPWRFFTSFLLTGPQLGILLDPYFGRPAPSPCRCPLTASF